MEFIEAIKNRRSIYGINNALPISDEEVVNIIKECVLHVPSAFNSQTARVIVAFGDNHLKVWDIILETLHKIVPEANWKPTDEKIAGFARGHATVLFFEDQSKVEELQKQFPLYADNFPLWSTQSSGMMQFAVWTSLEEKGVGANLQHYNPLIDDEIHATFNLPKSWKLMSQMPIGGITACADEKEFDPIENRLVVFK